MVVPGAGAYAASKSAVNMISAVACKELAGTGVTVGVVLPSTTATEFAGGRFQPGQQTVPGLTAHNPGYAAAFILRAAHRRGAHRHSPRSRAARTRRDPGPLASSPPRSAARARCDQHSRSSHGKSSALAPVRRT